MQNKKNRDKDKTNQVQKSIEKKERKKKSFMHCISLMQYLKHERSLKACTQQMHETFLFFFFSY